MIRLTPPKIQLLPPPTKPANGVRPVLPIGEGMAVAQCGSGIRIDLYGEPHRGYVSTVISPVDAKRLALELAILAKGLGV